MDYPVDFVTYLTDDYKTPPEVNLAVDNTIKSGFFVLPLTPDKFNIIGRPPSSFQSPEQSVKQDKPIKVYQAPFKHIKIITMPKMKKYFKEHPSAKGFFIAEGDLCLNEGYTFKDFYKEYGDTQDIEWIGYKKILRLKGEINYVVGNFLIYVPRNRFNFLLHEFEKTTKDIYSDRFFTNLVKRGEIKLRSSPVAGEIEHISAVAGGKIRKSKSHLNEQLPAYIEAYNANKVV